MIWILISRITNIIHVNFIKNLPWGGGGQLQYKNAGMCVMGVILKDVFDIKKSTPILKGSSAYFIPILWCNIKLKCIIPKGH